MYFCTHICVNVTVPNGRFLFVMGVYVYEGGHTHHMVSVTVRRVLQGVPPQDFSSTGAPDTCNPPRKK